MSQLSALSAVNCPFISQFVAAMNAKFEISRTLPLSPPVKLALVGRSGYHVLTYCAVRNVCCFEIHGIYVGRSPARMKRVNSVQAEPPGLSGDVVLTTALGVYSTSYRYTMSVRSLS